MCGQFVKKFSPLNNIAKVPSFLPPLEDQVFQMADCTSCLALEYLKQCPVTGHFIGKHIVSNYKPYMYIHFTKNYACCIIAMVQT